MSRDENNKRLAAWLGVPCWHENSQTWGASPCKHCGLDPSYIASRSDIPEQSELSYWNPDYYTPDGFFDLLDGLRAKSEGDMQVRIRQGKRDYFVEIDYLAECIGEADGPDLPTALIEATLQAMEKENE